MNTIIKLLSLFLFLNFYFDLEAQTHKTRSLVPSIIDTDSSSLCYPCISMEVKSPSDSLVFVVRNNGVVNLKKLYAQEIEVRLDALSMEWPDYVFHPLYPLMHLDSVSAYINANWHLPQIPSAACIKEKGINVAEMNALLLKKVEELTLYLIQQQQQINGLQKQIEEIECNQK